MKTFFRAHPKLFIAGGAGLIVFLALFRFAFMRDVRPMPLSRDDISEVALDFAAAEGWTSPNRVVQTVPVEGDDYETVRRLAEAAGTPPPDRRTLPDPGWETAIFTNPGSLRTSLMQRRQPDPILSIATTPEGRVVQYVEASSPIAGTTTISRPTATRTPPFPELNTNDLFGVDSDNRTNLSEQDQQRALEIARAFFARHAIQCDGIPTSTLARSTSDRVRLVYFTWDREGPFGSTERTRAIIWGDRLAAYDFDLVDPLRREEPSSFDWVGTSLDLVPVLGILAGITIVGVLLVVRRRQGELDLRSPALLFAGIFLGSVASIIMMLGTFAAMFGNSAGTIAVWLGFLNIAITSPIGIFLVSFVVAGAWAVGESQAYLVWPQQNLRPFSAWMRGDFRTREALEPVTAGYLSAFAALGAVTLLGLVSPRASQPSIASLFGFNSWPSMVAPITSGIVTGITLTVVSGILAMTYARLRTRRIWVLLVVGTIAMLSVRAAFSLTQFFPASSGIAPIVYVGLIVGLVILFVRSGPLASTTAVFVYMVFVSAYPVVLTMNPRHVAMGSWALAASFGFFGLAIYGTMRPRRDGGADAMPSHVRRAIDRLRITQEFDVARGVQAQLLPSAAPNSPGLDVAGLCVPANEVGGDYFDYFDLKDGRLGIAVGDVSGKGVGAAIYMTLTKSYMVTQTRKATDPALVLSRVNDHLRRNLARGTFVTMAYAIVDGKSRQIAYARAGHNPPLLIRADGDGDFLSAPGVTLGAVASGTLDGILRVESVEARPGDLLLLYTDGVTEAMDVRGDEYGDDRLIAFARNIARTSATAADVVNALLRDVRTFAGRAQQHDDITLVAVRFR